MQYKYRMQLVVMCWCLLNWKEKTLLILDLVHQDNVREEIGLCTSATQVEGVHHASGWDAKTATRTRMHWQHGFTWFRVRGVPFLVAGLAIIYSVHNWEENQIADCAVKMIIVLIFDPIIHPSRLRLFLHWLSRAFTTSIPKLSVVLAWY